MTTKSPAKETKFRISQILNRAAENEQIKKIFLADPKALLANENLHLPDSVNLTVFANVKDHYHLIIPQHKLDPEHQLFSFPSQPNFQQVIYYLITQIQENTKLKTQILNNATDYLRKNNIALTNNAKIEFHQTTQNSRFLIIPRKTERGEQLSDFEQYFTTHHRQSSAQPIVSDIVQGVGTISSLI